MLYPLILTCLLGVLGFTAGPSRADYPPPSEDGHHYYDHNMQGAWGLSGVYPADGLSGGLTGSGLSNAKCIDIPANLSLCRGIGYKQMRLPNLLEHDTIREVTQQASSWVHLLGVRCHADTQMFLCSMFAPVCLDRPISPCRSLCEAVKSGCENRMLAFGYPWPEMLRCDQFPADTELCIGLRPEKGADGSDLSCSACSQPDTFEGIVDNFCRAEFAMRVTVEESLVSGNDLKVTTKRKKKMFKAGAVKAKDIREAPLYIEGGGAGCDCSMMDTVNGRRQSVNYLVMGNKVGDRLVLSLVMPFDRKSRELARAMKAIKQGGGSAICKGGAVIVSGGAVVVGKGEGSSKVSGGKAGVPTVGKHPPSGGTGGGVPKGTPSGKQGGRVTEAVKVSGRVRGGSTGSGGSGGKRKVDTPPSSPTPSVDGKTKHDRPSVSQSVDGGKQSGTGSHVTDGGKHSGTHPNDLRRIKKNGDGMGGKGGRKNHVTSTTSPDGSNVNNKQSNSNDNNNNNKRG